LILVDDGIATGSTAKAAIKSLRARNASKIILADPVMPYDRVDSFKELVDDLEFIYAPKHFRAVGEFYVNFGQTEDKEVIELMKSTPSIVQAK